MYREFCEEPFKAKNLDRRLDNLIESLGKYFKLSNKLSFIFLAAYGIKNNVDISNYVYQGPGVMFRYETDKEYNILLDILIVKIAKMYDSNINVVDIFNKEELYNRYFDLLFRYANATGIVLLENELVSYRRRITSENENYFILDVLNILKDFDEMDVF